MKKLAIALVVVVLAAVVVILATKDSQPTIVSGGSEVSGQTSGPGGIVESAGRGNRGGPTVISQGPGGQSAGAVGEGSNGPTAGGGSAGAGVDTAGGDEATTGALAAAGGSGAAGNPSGRDGRSGSQNAGGAGSEGSTAGPMPKATPGVMLGPYVDESGPPDDATEDAAAIGGKVLRGDDTVQGAQLALLRLSDARTRRTRTDGEGQYYFYGVNPGSYALMLESPSTPDARRFLEIQPNGNRLAEDFVVPEREAAQGLVVNAANGNGVNGARVEVWQGSQNKGVVFADREGSFSLFPLPAAQYNLKVTADGYVPGEEPFAIPETGDPELLRVQLEPSGTVTGRVITHMGESVGGALVTLIGRSSFNDPFAAYGVETTDAGGRFAFSAPNSTPVGEFRVGALHADHVPGYSAWQQVGQTTDEIVVQLPAPAYIVGRTVDGQGEAIPDVDVAVKEGFPTAVALFRRFNRPLPNDRTDQNGVFRVGPVEMAATTLGFAADTYVSKDQEFSVGEPEVNIGDVELESSDDAKEGRVFGVVMDEQFNPMRDHYIMIQEPNTQETFGGRTDSRGGFTVDDIPEGDYVLVTNGSALRGDVYITMDQRYPFVRPGGDKLFLLYDLGQSLRLEVKDAFGQPVRNFRAGVQIRTTGATGHGNVKETTGMAQQRQFQTSDGVAIMEHLIAGYADVTVASEEHGSQEFTSVLIPVGGQGELEVRLEGGGVALGRVLAQENNSGLGGVNVRAEPPDGSPLNHPLRAVQYDTTTDGSGSFRLAGLPVGEADLVFSRDGRVTKRLTGVSVNAEEEKDLGPIPLQRAAMLAGTVSDDSGAMLGDVQIRVDGQVLFSDPEGRFFSNSLEPGEKELRFRDPMGRYRRAPLIANLKEGQRLDLDVKMDPVD